ncbi:MAG TPA: GNAT family N-acetyltransferase [Patescibacteria group bacterium]
MDNFSYFKASLTDIDAIYTLVSDVFDQFVAPNYIEEGNQEFYKYLDKNAVNNRLQNNHFIILCKARGKVVGLIEVRNLNHVSMLFVNAAYQGRGIAKQLLSRALEICKKQDPQLKEVSVHSSPNSVVIYEKLGFVKVKEEQIINGIRFTPMILKI